MASTPHLRVVRAQVAVMMGAIVVLSSMRWLTLETFFVVSYLGFLVIILLTPPRFVIPRWRRRLLVVVIGGLVIFGFIVIRRILEILPPEVIG